MSSFGQHLKAIMDERNIGVNELSEKCGVSGAHISRIINGKRPAPKPETIKRFAEALGVTYEALMKVAGYINNENPISIPSIHKEPKRPKDLAKILEQREDLMFNGVPLDDEAKKDILHVIEFELYRRAKDLNKRKKDS